VSTEAKSETRPDIDERVLGFLDRSLVPDAELPTEPVGSWWYGANWERIIEALHRDQVVVLSCESGEYAAAKVAALYECGVDLVCRHDPARARLYLARKGVAQTKGGES
jgi:hypothetical protein